jgi:hypothetical protein
MVVGDQRTEALDDTLRLDEGGDHRQSIYRRGAALGSRLEGAARRA